MGRFDGKVALITGAARGQGRTHAVRFAKEGADVILLDACRAFPEVEYPLPTPEELFETQALVEKEGRRAVCFETDVRDEAAVGEAFNDGVGQLGRLDFVCANAGVLPAAGESAKEIGAWRIGIDTMLSGAFYTMRAAVAPLLDAGPGGSIVVTSSIAGLRSVTADLEMLTPGLLGYTAAKHGVTGLVRNFAQALGGHGIRVNSVAPMGVRTPMIENDLFRAVKHAAPPGWMGNVMNIDRIEPEDVTDAVVWLCSEESRYITGSNIAVDAGSMLL